jgi:hypothetical protein
MNDHTFFSIDRLVEFGLGLGVAQQLAASMNHALQNTSIPGLQTPMVDAIQTHYHIMLDEKPAGPFTTAELARLITEGKVTKTSYVWRPGMVQWSRAENVPDVLKLVALTPPPFKAPVSTSGESA